MKEPRAIAGGISRVVRDWVLRSVLGLVLVPRLVGADDWQASPSSPAEMLDQRPATLADLQASTEPSETSRHPSVDHTAPRWLDQLQHSDSRYRRNALQALENASETIGPEVAERIAYLAEHDPDAIVRTRAQLILMGPRAFGKSRTTHPRPSYRTEFGSPKSLNPIEPLSHTATEPDWRDDGPTLISTTLAAWDDATFTRRAQTAAFTTSDEATESPFDFPSPAESRQPLPLFRPFEPAPDIDPEASAVPDFDTFVLMPREAPTGYSGPSSVMPSEYQTNGHFVPMEDRWRVGFPEYDRYGKDFPPVDDYPSKTGRWYDPFNQNVLKGDYPISGQHLFLNVTASSQMLQELRSVPTATTPFESTVEPNQQEFFGNPQQYFYMHNFALSTDLFHGNAAFKPVDWRVKLTSIFNLNYLDANELGVVNPDVRAGTTRFRDDYALQEWFVEKKLADLGPDYDFVSMRVGSQPFTSDFRGFIFSDINRGVRLFGTREANRDQFNLVWFAQQEKDTNSMLNTFGDREQQVLIANYFRQDFIVPGYTAQASVHYNHDIPSFKFDDNDFLVRPDPVGVFREHQVDVWYLGFAGDGHIGRVNVSNAFYWALGHDSFNPIAGREQSINGQMAALELSYDRDWVRFRSSFFWSSGDDSLTDQEARGFDSILDNPNFAGGGFSYWQRQAIKLFGVNLTQRESLIPDLRSSKIQGQANFVNPGLFLYNIGMDLELTPKVRVINNVNFLWFHKTEVLERFTFQDNIDHPIGTDLSMGVEYRPWLNDNVLFIAGAALFLPATGFDDLFGKTDPFTTANSSSVDSSALFSTFVDLVVTF